MSDYNPYNPTKEEVSAAEMATLRAAFEALKPIMDDELTPQQAVTIFLKAFKAARDAATAFGRGLLAKNPGFTHDGLHLDAGPIVCSALYALENDCLELTSPHSVAGHRLVALVNASKAMDALSEFEAAVSDGEISAFMAGDALKLAMTGK